MHRGSLLPLLLVALACAKPATPPDPEAVRAQIQARNDVYAAAMMAGDSAAFLDLYAPDVVIVRPRMTDIVGRAAAVQDLAASIRRQTDTLLRVTIRTISVDATDSLAFEVGTGEFEHRPKHDPNAKVAVSRTKYITFWVKGADGVWRARRDLTVADTLPPG